MAVPNIKRNVEAGQIFIGLWHSGLFTQRSPLFTPISAMGMQIISRYDTLWNGLNMELSLSNTLVRRPGFPKFCSAAFSSTEYPLTFYSFKTLDGTIYPMVDTGTAVYKFSPTALTSIFTKAVGAGQSSFQKVGDTLYMADGVDIEQWIGGSTTPFALGIAIPVSAPTVTTGTGYLLPTAGWSYGYSFINSNTSAVSTMSPATASVGDLNLTTVIESSVTCPVTNIDSVVTGDGPGVVTWTCNNNFSAGQTVTVTGSSPDLISNMKCAYVITACGSAYWSASTAVWGPAYHGTPGEGFGQNAPFDDTDVTACNAVLSPITIPNLAALYTYTVVNSGALFSPSNLFGGSQPATVIGVSPPKTYTQVASSGDVVSSGQFYCDGNGSFIFYSGDTGKKISITYQITPAGGASTVSFTVTGPSSVAIQPDMTGLASCDCLTVYRTHDGDAAGGPWFYIAQIPNNVALVSASVAVSGANTVYTFANPVPGGANDGFATAPGTGGATIAGFANAGNNGTFSIVSSTNLTMTCANPAGVTETHAATCNATTWTYTDTGSVYGYSFDPSDQDAELDILIEAPIDDENNPPPNTTNPLTTSVTGAFSLLCYNAGRLWGAVDNYVYFAGGPDVTYGSPEDSWPPANVFTFPGKVTAMVSVNSGLLVFTDSDMFMIYGTSTANFYSNLYQKNFGVAWQNAVAQDGDVLFMYSTKSQLFSFTNQLTEIGSNIGDQLKATFAPGSTYLSVHRNGSDAGLFVSDGTSNMFKYRLDQQSWSTVSQVVGGAGAIASIETTASNYILLTGRTTGSGYILGRDETAAVFLDSGTAYPCNAIVGSLMLSPPGSVSILESVLLETIPVGAGATVSILLNEIAGTYVTLRNPIPDPALLPPSQSITSQRYWLRSAASALPQQVRHLMVQIAFSSENARNEILTMSLS